MFYFTKNNAQIEAIRGALVCRKCIGESNVCYEEDKKPFQRPSILHIYVLMPIWLRIGRVISTTITEMG
jgi:hypothetical protein